MPIATGHRLLRTRVGRRRPRAASWPTGPTAPTPTRSVLPTRHNTAIVLDTDSVFHGVDRVGPDDAEPSR